MSAVLVGIRRIQPRYTSILKEAQMVHCPTLKARRDTHLEGPPGIL